MPECQAKFCTVVRGQGISTCVIPDPAKEYDRCARWIHNLKNMKLDIKTYKYNPNKIVCEKHFEEESFKEDMRVSGDSYIIMHYSIQSVLSLHVLIILLCLSVCLFTLNSIIPMRYND